MVDVRDDGALDAEERAVVGRVVSERAGRTVTVEIVTRVWDRPHVLRVVTADGSSVIVKRPRRPREGEADDANFAAEWAALEFLAGMPDSPVPAMFGGDWERRLLVMEELPAGRSLAASLLDTDPVAATDDLRAYAAALARLHAWTAPRLPEYLATRARLGLADSASVWRRTVDDTNRAAFVTMLDELGISTAGLAAELDGMRDLLFRGPYQALIHGDACPDNVRIVGDSGRLLDFEISGTGSIALDASFLWAPFPSCWCFAALTPDHVREADDTYRSTLADGGITLGDDWTTVIAAALTVWVVARWRLVREALLEDRRWGTTTMRPRLIAWAHAVVDATASTLPHTHRAMSSLADVFRERWPTLRVPSYPAFSGGQAAVTAPAWWSESS